jgi:hypothetical protein
MMAAGGVREHGGGDSRAGGAATAVVAGLCGILAQSRAWSTRRLIASARGLESSETSPAAYRRYLDQLVRVMVAGLSGRLPPTLYRAP